MVLIRRHLGICFQHHTNYANSEFFHIQDALAKYNSMVEYESSSDLKIINNRQVDANKLHEIVVNNNNAYMASYTGALYEEFSSSYFEQAFNAVVATINKNLAEDYEQNIDVNQLDKNLQELKILCNHGQGNGVMVEDDKILSLNINVIEVFGGMDFFYEVACHETNHLIQASSNEEKEHEGYTKNTGIYYEWADLPVNALSYQWFVEGCAEKLMNVYNDVSGENIVYPEYMKTIDTLTLATILRDDVSELTIPRLSLQPDLNKFLRIFNANSEEDVEEIIKMMFSFEIIYGRNKAFYDNCQIEVPYKYEFSLYSSAAQTLTKIFYTNLLDAIGNKGESLESIFGLIKLFENDMNRLVKYNDSSRDEYNSDFIAFYDNVQQTFFGCLAQQLGITSQDVFTMYNNYYMSDENLSTSNLLSDDEISYLTKYNTQNVGMKPTNVVLTNRK